MLPSMMGKFLLIIGQTVCMGRMRDHVGSGQLLVLLEAVQLVVETCSRVEVRS